MSHKRKVTEESASTLLEEAVEALQAPFGVTIVDEIKLSTHDYSEVAIMIPDGTGRRGKGNIDFLMVSIRRLLPEERKLRGLDHLS